MQIGKCGMPCELCPMYHIATQGRCTGCSAERGCSIIRCCGQNDVFVCAECHESPCEKITKMKEFSNCNTNKVWERNLSDIHRLGYDEWVKAYSRKAELINIALHKYNAGRAKNFICRLFMLYEVDVLEKIMEQAEKIECEDKKEAERQFKELVNTL